MHHSIERFEKLQLELADLKKVFEEWISSEVEFEKLKPLRTRIHALEKALEQEKEIHSDD